MISVTLYLGSLVLVNLAYLQPWTWHTFPVVGAWSAGSILVGAVFVARDYAQRNVGGRKVLYAMAAGIAITAAMSGRLALASGLAFAVSEGFEAVIFTVTRRPFRERVVRSAVPSVVLDSAVFLLVAGFFTPALFLAQVISKLVAILVFIPATAPRTRLAGGTRTP